MMRHVAGGLVLAFLLAASGCEPGRSAYATAAAADRAGSNAVDVPALYDAVCTGAPTSPSCTVARRRATELRLDHGLTALREGRLPEATALLDQAAKDPSIAPASSAVATSFDLAQAKRYTEAVAQPDHVAATASMADVAKTPSAAASAARAWLEKSGPKALLDGVSAACRPDGQGSCFALARELRRLYPEAPEVKAAAAVINAERERQAPAVKRAENFLVQRLMIFDREKKIERCAAENRLADDALQRCTAHESPPEVEVMPTVAFLENAWKKNLATVTDPGLVKHLEECWQHLSETGENDPDPDLHPDKPSGPPAKAAPKREDP